MPLIILAFLFIWNAKYVGPLYISSNEVSESVNDKISILSINLLSSNTNYKKVLELIKEKDPDILIFMELTPKWDQKLSSIYQLYPYKASETRVDNFGIAMLSKLQMESSVTYFENNIKPSIIGKLNFSEEQLTIIATHPIPPINSETFELRNAQLMDIANKRASFSDNFILIGDFNTSSFSPHFQELLAKSNLKDSRKGFGIGTTWPADFYPLRTTLDHCLVSKGIKVLDQSPQRDIGSDHLPIFLEIAL
tara:strand:- start:190107 stop:190859 length:753 start_codon:yes stop_codon:yes gene_type:complete